MLGENHLTEIILLGTFYFEGRSDIFPDSSQAELDTFTDKLALLKPTKIAVEMPKKRQETLNSLYDTFDPATVGEEKAYFKTEVDSFFSSNEVVQVACRLGKKLNHTKLFAVDEPVELSDELANLVFPHIPMGELFRRIDLLTEKAKGLQDLYRIHNSDEYMAQDGEIYIAANKVNLGNYEGCQFMPQWYERNLKIFSNLQNICEDGDRVLLLIGSSHLRILKDLVNASQEMKLLSAF